MIKTRSDLIGARFGRLTVVQQVDDYISPRGVHLPKYEVVCDCGKHFDVIKGNLLSGCTKSCGELHSERVKEAKKIHGYSRTTGYDSWKMLTRYAELKNIPVENDWETLEGFMDWAKTAGYKDGMYLSRVDKKKGYFSDNCVWTNKSHRRKSGENISVN